MKLLMQNLVVLIFSVAMLPPALSAQEEDDRLQDLPPFVDTSRRLEVSASYILQGSGMNLLHIEGGEETVNAGDLTRGTLELNFSYFFDRHKTFGVEALFGYTWAWGQTQLPSEGDDPDNPVIYPVEIIDHKVITYGGNIIWNLGYLDIVPFVYAGFGFDQFTPAEDSDFPIEDTFYHVAFGLGFKYFLTEWFGVRVSLDDYFYFISDDNAVGNQNQFRLKIGAVYTF
jgi:hypothetical protein